MTKFVITIPCYNAEQYIERALISAFDQDYDKTKYRIILIDDASTDDTWNKAKRFEYKNFEFSPSMRTKITLYARAMRVGVLANHYAMNTLIDDDDVIVNLDGDDEFAHSNVLRKLDEIYSDPNVWITYGSFAYDLESHPDLNTDSRGYLSKMPDDRHERTYPFVCSHLRTYKAWLFKRIRLEDLKRNGNFYQMAMDHALMYPMIEMAGPMHARYIHDILYLYNACNPLNEHTHLGTETVMETANYIKSQKRYPLLEKAKDYPWM